MKKMKFTGKLSLNKEVIAKLNFGQLNQINGGGTILTTLHNCGEAPGNTKLGITCVTEGFSCTCPTVSLHSECSC